MTNKKISLDGNFDNDIVVIGGGGAGMVAAVAAAEKGAKVTVVEKQALGGTSALAQGLMAIESPIQKSAGVSITRDEAFKFAMEYTHWKLNPRLVRKWINQTGETIDWLEARGIKFGGIPPFAGEYRVFHRIEGAGPALIDAMHTRCDELGVKILLHCPVKKIMTDASGAVTGVIVESDQKQYNINAKSVIIASGGFGGNKKMLAKYYPEYDFENTIFGGTPNMGDGLVMAYEIGAKEEMGSLLLHPHCIRGSRILTHTSSDPKTIWVNKNGLRFADETIGSHHTSCGNAVYRQPEKCVYVIFDETIKPLLTDIRLGSPEELMSDIRMKEETGEAKIASDWNEMAEWIGVSGEVLQATMAEYNTYCDEGHDDLFAKEPKFLIALRKPPYYGVKCHLGSLTTLGGIMITENTEVLNQQEIPIPGLFAAGDSATGSQKDTYNMVLAGSAFSFAINSGRIAGENAAEFVSAKRN